MITTSVNVSGLNDAIEKFSALTRKDLEMVYKQQAAILVGHVIAITPPGNKQALGLNDSGGIGLTAKKRGEAAIAADIHRIFPTSKLSTARLQGMIKEGFIFQVGKGRKHAITEVAETEEDLARIHKFARNPKTGRTRRMSGAGMAITKSALLRRYIKSQTLKVGKLNAGWIRAAQELKTAKSSVPAWITRHGAGRGGVNIGRNSRGISVKMYNHEIWFPGNMESRVAAAVARRKRGLQIALAAIIERNEKKASDRMRR